jgi:hypothetical protein
MTHPRSRGTCTFLCPPTRVFIGETVKLDSTLKLVLDAFDAYPSLLSLRDSALCQRALGGNDTHFVKYHAQQDKYWTKSVHFDLAC